MVGVKRSTWRLFGARDCGVACVGQERCVIAKGRQTLLYRPEIAWDIRPRDFFAGRRYHHTGRNGNSTELTLSVLRSGERAGERVQVEPVFGGAARADGLHGAKPGEVPVAIANLDVELAVLGPGGKQHRRLLAATFPAVGWRGDTDHAGLGFRCGWMVVCLLY